jgi:hypothetical protein
VGPYFALEISLHVFFERDVFVAQFGIAVFVAADFGGFVALA